MVSQRKLQTLEREATNLSDEIVAFLQRMVQTNSVNPPGDYSDILDVLSTKYEQLGWDIDVMWAPDELINELDLIHSRPNLIGYVQRGSGPTILLNAHLDTVPADSEDWTVDPFGGVVEDGCVWGRGAEDSKGRIASYTMACYLLHSTGLMPENATIILAMTADEEIGGEAGAGYVSRHLDEELDYVVVEGGAWNEIWHAGSGIVRYRITTSGKAAHAGTRPETGANALYAAARVLSALEEYAESLKVEKSTITGIGHPTCVPAIIEGGSKTNVVPATCSITIDTRVPPDFDMGDSERRMEELINGIELPKGTDVEVDVLSRNEPYHFSPDADLITIFRQNAEKLLDSEVEVLGTRGSTDARYWSKTGASCVNYGPGDENSNAHAADEHIEIEQVIDVGTIVAASVIELCTAET